MRAGEGMYPDLAVKRMPKKRTLKDLCFYVMLLESRTPTHMWNAILGSKLQNTHGPVPDMKIFSTYNREHTFTCPSPTPPPPAK